jgi:hypothetical protein
LARTERSPAKRSIPVDFHHRRSPAGTSLFKRGSIVTLLAKQIEHTASRRDLELAAALLHALAYRHRRAFDAFMAKYVADLPPEAREELSRL